MARNYPNFLDAYMEYANDGFCPPQFHLWTGLTLIAAALERKVWLEQELEHASIMHYPNIYTLCVSHPGVGKSTAMERGVELLDIIRTKINMNFKIIPNQATEPALVDLMKIRSEIEITPRIFAFHSSGFFYASEASASALQNLYGDFNATLTAFYDCPKWFRKKIKGEKEPTEIENVCFNLLAGCTFDYLKRLVNEESVMGGLASRFIYVIAKERKIRQSRWVTKRVVAGNAKKMQELLVEDLDDINKLVGRITPDSEFIALWEAEQPAFDKFLIDLDSPRMESLYARKFTNLMKICMLLCVAEGDSLRLTAKHWHRGKQLIADVTKDNAMVISSAMMADKESQSGTTQLIAQTVKKNGGAMPMRSLKLFLSTQGNNIAMVNQTIEFMLSSGWFSLDADSILHLIVDPDTKL